MQIVDDPQDALDLWNTDETQWLLTDGTQYAVCTEPEALCALQLTHWTMTSPETLERQLAQAYTTRRLLMDTRYRATPSRLEPSSWNVLDTQRRNAWGDLYVTVPLVTRFEAQQCATCLNHGQAAYAWREPQA